MFAQLRWDFAKRRLASYPSRPLFAKVKQAYQLHRARVEDFPPNAEGYAQLAALWDAYAAWFVPGYGPFLAAAADYYRRPIRTVLDLACGTGLLTRQVARRAESVVGLDLCTAMLAEARARTKDSHVRYVRGDFRDFRLGATFDAVICGSDSLNYITSPAELTCVFRCVHRHLLPGGVFAFDVLDDRAFRAMAQLKVIGGVGSQRFEAYYFYDPECRFSESRVVFQDAIERHRRIPIETADVGAAASDAGLEVVEHFAALSWLGSLISSVVTDPIWARQFYVLRRSKSGG